MPIAPLDEATISTTQEGTALASAARTATAASSDLTNYRARGVQLFVNVTAAAAAENLTIRAQLKDPIGGGYYTVAFTTTITATGLYIYTLYPGASAGGTDRVSMPLPRTWRVSVAHSASGSWTYSVGYCYLP